MPDINLHTMETLCISLWTQWEKHLQWLVFTKLVISVRRLEIDPCLSPCTKWTKDINIRPYTLNQREVKVGIALNSAAYGETLWKQHRHQEQQLIHGTSWAWKASVWWWEPSFGQSRSLQKMTFTHYTSDRELTPKMYKELKNWTSRKHVEDSQKNKNKCLRCT